MQLYILAIVQRKRTRKKKFSLKHSIVTILRNTKGIDKESKDNVLLPWVPKQKGNLNKTHDIKKNNKKNIKKKRVKNNETLCKFEGWQKRRVLVY